MHIHLAHMLKMVSITSYFDAHNVSALVSFSDFTQAWFVAFIPLVAFLVLAALRFSLCSPQLLEVWKLLLLRSSRRSDKFQKSGAFSLSFGIFENTFNTTGILLRLRTQSMIIRFE